MSLLRELREKVGLTQAQLAELAKTSQPMIGRLESGKRVLTVRWAKALAPFLGTTPEALLFGITEENEADRRSRLEEKLKLLINEYGVSEVSAIIVDVLRDVSKDDD